MATDERIKDGLATICDRWTIVDLFEAHAVLDALDRATRAAEKARNNGTP